MKTSLIVRSVVMVAVILPFAVHSARAEEAAAIAAPAVQSEKSEFVGIWKAQDGKGRDYYITIAADGSATSTWTATEDQRRNQTGVWKAVEGGVLVSWHNEWRDQLVAVDSGFLKKAFAPKMKLEGEPANTSPAVKVDAISGK